MRSLHFLLFPLQARVNKLLQIDEPLLVFLFVVRELLQSGEPLEELGPLVLSDREEHINCAGSGQNSQVGDGQL